MSSIVVMGVAGCGKSSLGAVLADTEALPLIEGDDFHSAANRRKMAEGTPLTDADRDGWLDTLAAELARHPAGAVLTCSALKRRYRDRLRSAVPGLGFAHRRPGRAGTGIHPPRPGPRALSRSGFACFAAGAAAAWPDGPACAADCSLPAAPSPAEAGPAGCGGARCATAAYSSRNCRRGKGEGRGRLRSYRAAIAGTLCTLRVMYTRLAPSLRASSSRCGKDGGFRGAENERELYLAPAF